MRSTAFILPLFLFLFVCNFATRLCGQSDEFRTKSTEPFILLDDGTLLRTNDFQKDGSILFEGIRHSNGNTITPAEIKFLRNDKGYFALNSGNYAKRILAGRLDLYQQVDNTGKPATRKYYDNRNIEDLQHLKYKHLAQDVLPLNGNLPMVIQQNLEKGKKREVRKNVLTWGGLGMLIAGGLMFEAGNGNLTTGSQVGLLLSGVGIATSITGLATKPEKIHRKTIDLYNAL